MPTKSFSELVAKLNQTKIKRTDPAVYEVIKGIIETGDQNQQVTNNNVIVNTNGLDGPIVTYDIAAGLANSRKLVAGTNVILDESIGGELIINSSGGGISAAQVMTRAVLGI